MKKKINFFILFMVFGLALQVFSQGRPEAAGVDGNIDYRDPARLRELVEKKSEPYILVDVRTPEEFNTGYIPTSVNIPVQIIEKNPPEVPKDSLVILYCRTGNRSGQAKRMLENLGYSRIVDFGGVNRWNHELIRD